MRVNSRFQWHKILLMMTLLVLPLVYTCADESSDLLLYTISDVNFKPLSLMLYDPATQVSTPLLKDIEFNHAILSIDGRLAFSADTEGIPDVYILDIHHPDQSPTHVTDSIDASVYPLAWSADGQYLALVLKQNADSPHVRLYVWDGTTITDITPETMADTAVHYEPHWSFDGHLLAFVLTDENQNHRLYVWDGTTSINIMPQDLVNFSYSYDPAWSLDGRLAFTINDWKTQKSSEIYLWDGLNTINLFQNPANRDNSAVWSADGQLAFQSEYNGKIDILVWDGVSFRDGLPDATTFINVTSELTTIGLPTWTSENQLAFSGKSTQDTYSQIYVWDGKNLTGIDQNKLEGNHNPVWSRDGHWAYMNDHLSTHPTLYVRDADNQLLLTTPAYQYTKLLWSSRGDLLYCTWDDLGWILAVWDGKAVHKVTRGEEMLGQWQSGSSVFCGAG